MPIRAVGVVGAGVMGAGIIEQVARCGYDVIAREVSEAALESGRQRTQTSMARAVERGKLSAEERDQALARIRWTTELQQLAGCQLVIEAIVENLEQKRELFAEMDQIVPAQALLASNTSSVSITALAGATGRPDRVAGAHFFNPVPVMAIVELVRGLQTSDETVSALREFGESLGKRVVVVKDSPGFIVNYLLIPYLLDAARAVQNDVASAEDIDAAMTLGTGIPMGPVTLIDFIGVDTVLFIADEMYRELRDPKYAAPPLLRQMVAAGRNGRKSGQGFYEYARRG